MHYLNPDKALIFRITHVSNLPWILDHGLQCRSSQDLDPGFRDIGNQELISKRAHHVVPIPPGGSLSDYIPFYFTPRSPMLLNITTGHGGMRKTPAEEIVMLVSSLNRAVECGLTFVFSDRHAFLQTALFSKSLAELPTMIDWNLLQSKDFRRDPENPERFDRYQAEALVHRHLPIDGLLGLACVSEAVKERILPQLNSRDIRLEVVVKHTWFFR